LAASWTRFVAITPPSDIVLDVARAADPERYRAAVDRLTRLRATAEATAPPAQFMPARPSASPAANALPADTAPGTPRRRLDAYGQFEAFVLQSFLQSMMPRNATNVYGRGSAGEFWRSMLAEKMGDELARSGQVGIARRLTAGSSPSAQPVANNTANPLTPPPLVSTLNHTQLPANVTPAVDAPAPATPADGERS
jgi:peptidoglycan hydrolase FlgJ